MSGLAQFGHHPDPTIDAEVEVQRLVGQLSECHAVMLSVLDLSLATPAGLNVKGNVRHWLHQHGVTDLGVVAS